MSAFRPKKSLSQNFLYDPRILKRIIQIAGVGPDDHVLEIGPGPGSLTEFLLERAGHVTAVELDGELFKNLAERFEGRKNLDLIRADALSLDYNNLGRFKAVANIPYHITTPLIFKLMEARPNVISMTLTVQKEVAERLAAGPGGKDYGVLTIMVGLYAEARTKFIIPRTAFRPMPRVDSACVHIRLYEEPHYGTIDEEFFRKVVKTAFSTRRKTLHNCLKPFGSASDEALESLGIDSKRRPETLGIAEFAALSERIRGLSGNP